MTFARTSTAAMPEGVRELVAAGLPPDALAGRVCLVTGATSGHGRAVADGLAALGAELVLLGRDEARCRSVARELAAAWGREPELLLCDLSSGAAVAQAAQRYLESGRPLHVLVNNAGAVHLRRQETIDGYEATFAVNYLALFQLTQQLLPRLLDSAQEAGVPSRVVQIASDAHRIVRLDLDDLQTERQRYHLMGAYGRSKQAILYYTRELARRTAQEPLTVNACDPGPVESRIGQNNPGLAADLLRKVVMRYFFPSAARAARTAIYLAASPEVARATGAYYKGLRPRRPRLPDEARIGPALFALSEQLVAR